MNEKEVRSILGEPDKIIPRRHWMVSLEWICSGCNFSHKFDHPQRPPAPCCHCGGIGFAKPSISRN